MNTLDKILLAAAIWLVVSIPVALLVGRVIRLFGPGDDR